MVWAQSGREALRVLLDPGEFALILLDIQMPGMDGFELAELIRQHKVHRQTPIIFVTASGDDLHVQRCYALGAVDYILAPVVPTVLRAKVSVLVELHKKTQQVRAAGRGAAPAGDPAPLADERVARDPRRRVGARHFARA